MTPTLIIDVSNNQGRIDWKKVAGAKVYGAYLKATEGHTYLDSKYVSYIRDARAAGLHVGAYHFARPDNNGPEAEAEHFLSAIGPLPKTQLRPVLDFETQGHIGCPDATAWARAFNKRFHVKTGIWPMFYSYPYFIQAMKPTRPIGGGLWLASYGVNDGNRHPLTVPSPWKTVKLHQFTSNGIVPGISGHVDLNHLVDTTPGSLLVRI